MQCLTRSIIIKHWQLPKLLANTKQNSESYILTDWPLVRLEGVPSHVLQMPRQRMFQRNDDITVPAQQLSSTWPTWQVVHPGVKQLVINTLHHQSTLHAASIITITIRRRSWECTSPPTELLRMRPFEEVLRGHVQTVPETSMSNFRSAASTVLELLAFNAQKCRDHVTLATPFLKKF